MRERWRAMLTALSIRDVVLIDRLDLSFGPGLTVLTGETGAGKSILLDSLGLALGVRAESGLVRAGCDQASVAACFSLPAAHPVLALLAEQGLEADDEIVLRRIVMKDGRSRAFVNDQPAGVALLRRIGAHLVEVQGQHEQMGLADPASHTALLDAFGVPPESRDTVVEAWRAWRQAVQRLDAAVAAVEAARRDEDWLRHAVDELTTLSPTPNEEDELVAARQRLQQNERQAEAIAAAIAELMPRDRRGGAGPATMVRAAARLLQRLVPAPGTADPSGATLSALAALERAEEALAEADTILSRLATDADADPRLLEQTEERLFALRAAARKHGVAVVELPGLLGQLRERLAHLESGEAARIALERVARETRTQYVVAARALTEARRGASDRLRAAVMAELPPLRFDKARFFVEVDTLPETAWGTDGTDQVRFLVATNPGQEPGPLGKIASGGELSRLMLAVKVVLASGSAVPTLVFDEVDAGVGGATAASVGERLARVADAVQVLVVTHSPQVAARGATHFLVSKAVHGARTATTVAPLGRRERREEIARMLAGETVTAAARAAARDLLGAAG
jgi:DNA repair protein RecN (Recombination protein N)